MREGFESNKYVDGGWPLFSEAGFDSHVEVVVNRPGVRESLYCGYVTRVDQQGLYLSTDHPYNPEPTHLQRTVGPLERQAITEYRVFTD